MTALRFYNTISGEIEAFTPIDATRVGLYVCGPTVYAPPHIGNARSAVAFDLLYRLLCAQYGAAHVVYVRNITDIDDKIIQCARAQAIPFDQLTRDMTTTFHDDMAALGVLSPQHEPRASRYIGAMVDMIETLLQRGYAYCAENHVLFEVAKAPAGVYGQLSGRADAAKAMRAGARIEPASYKRQAEDFILWKPALADEPGWDSPWGNGRPGWHIECSAMARHLLGRVFDIHGGGIDLVFPHHENEIIQTRCCDDGAVQANYWLHNGHLSLSGEKMSKSLGNIVLVRDLLDEGWSGSVIRHALLSAQYRQPLEFGTRLLGQSRAALDRLHRLTEDCGPPSWPPSHPESPAWRVLHALSADINTPRAFSVLSDIARQANKASAEVAATLRGDLSAALHLLGLAKQTSSPSASDDDEIHALVEARNVARAQRDYQAADRLRDELLARDIVLEDGETGTNWRRRRR